MKAPFTIISCINSYFFMSVSSVPLKFIADALFTKTSMRPNFFMVFSTASFTSFSNLTSHLIANTSPPSSFISFSAVYIVPPSLAFSTSDFPDNILESVNYFFFLNLRMIFIKSSILSDFFFFLILKI